MSFLLLIAAALTLMVLAAMSIHAFLRKGWWEGFRFLEAAAALIAGYAVLLVAVSLLSSAPTLKAEEKQCFGEWCVAVSHTLYHDNKVYCTLNVENRSTKGEVSVVRPRVLAVDSARRYFTAGYESGQPLDEPVGAGMSFVKTYQFALLQDSENPVLEVAAGPWYEVLMVGHPNSLFHARRRTPVE